ncbi:MAG TPA: YfhO family protein [Thermoanaerobaculia bacterium]|nr:YfhO family protein [Thermoanaerobaculia bacterium]
MTARRHDWIALAILALLATLLFIDVVIGTHNFYMRDLTRYYYPAKQVLREIVQNGEFPFWNRTFGAGQPIAANPEHEVFYPLTWLILLPSYDLGYRLHILAHLYIGLFGMYALLRSMELRVPAAFFGAFSFALGGIYLSYVNLLPILFCAAWLPLTCLFVRRFLLAPSLRFFALASLFLGMQFLVAEPTTVMQTGFLIGMYALYRGWYAARDAELPWKHAVPEMLARVAFIALISIAAFSIGAVQMLPALDHVADSARSRPFDFSLVSAWSMPWAKFAELIYPNFLGHISIKRVMWYWGGGLYPGMGSPFLFNIYSGLLLIALAVSGFFVRARGARFVLLLILVSAAIALGGHTPVLGLLYKAGIAESIRYPEKFILVAIFAAIVFAAQMLDRMLAGSEEVRDAAMGFVLATTIVAVVIALSALTPYYEKAFMKVWGLTKGGNAVRMVTLSTNDWILAAVRGAVFFAILRLVFVVKRPLWLALAAVLVVGDVAPVMHQINPRMPSRFFTEEPPAVRTLPANRSAYRIFHEADWYGREPVASNYFAAGDAVYWIVRNGLMPMIPAGYGLQMVIDRDYDKTALLPTLDLIDSVWDVKRSGRTDWWRPFAAMGNIWYRAEYRPFAEEKKRTRGNLRAAQPIDFHEIPEHYPRYYFADDVVTIRDRRDFSNKLSKPGAYSLTTAFVRHLPFSPPRGEKVALREAKGRMRGAPGIVHGVSETANTARIDVEAFGKAFLVMSVTPHKYWRVTIDGRAVQPLVANVGFQGVVVPAGRHRIEMRYRNDLILLGGTISLIAALALIAAALVPRHHDA